MAGCSRRSLGTRDIVVMLAILATVVSLSFGRSDGDFGEDIWRFSVLAGFFGLVVLYTLWEKRSQGRAFEAHWRRICHVLDEEHSHEGAMLRGTWKGMPFRAYATAYIAGQYAGTVSEYSVTIPAALSGPEWHAERAYDRSGSRGSHLWTVRADARNAEECLREAGLLTAIEDAEQRTMHFRPGSRLLFRSSTTQVAYEDASGEPPCANDLVVHLDLAWRANEVHTAAMLAMDAYSVARPRLRMGDPPLWLLTLWLPASLVGATVGGSWPWAYALLPVTLAAPYLWRVRIRRP